ncbi:MAG: FG-GAP repeat protein, partial [Proteobacteria bacterium]|nr:FG-GAP repeat protein [Pseudomonadota bacterium]
AAGDINGDGVADLLIGAPYHTSSTGRSYVVFGDAPPVLVQNQLQLYSGETVPVDTTFLSAFDRNHNNYSLIFYPANVTHGYFESVSQLGVPLTNFTQSQLLNGTIQFVHDGSAFSPGYNITVRSDGIAWTGPHAANITFMPSTTIVPTPTPSLSPSTVAPATPTPSPTLTPTPTPTPRAPIVLVNNQLTFNNGGQVILSPAQLQATEVGYDNNQLVFLISNVDNGYFTLTNQNTTHLTAFNQSQIINGEVLFVHSGNSVPPSYTVMVTDGVQYTVPNTPVIHLTDAPIIIENTLTLQPGESVTLTPANLNVNVTDGSTPGQVICQVRDLQHAM